MTSFVMLRILKTLSGFFVVENLAGVGIDDEDRGCRHLGRSRDLLRERAAADQERRSEREARK